MYSNHQLWPISHLAFSLFFNDFLDTVYFFRPAVGLLDFTIDYDLFLTLCFTVLTSLLPGAFISVSFCDALGDLTVALVKSRPTLAGFFLPP